ncbi:MAG: hypothetical protein KAQ93_01015 [Spirochaetales bacterium]|nr:hypothetical protein [Spirochaetales bacterium]
MKTKYAVLNDKLLPDNVAELLLAEGVGSAPVSVQVKIKLKDAPDFIHLENLLLQADRAGIDYTYTILGITEMLLKLIKNNNRISDEIFVKIIQGHKTFLYAGFTTKSLIDQNCLFQ